MHPTVAMRPFWAPEVEVAIDVELAATIEAWPWAAGWRTLSSCQRLEGDRNGQAWIAFTDAWMAQAFAIAVGGSVSPPGWTVDLGHVRGAGNYGSRSAAINRQMMRLTSN